MYQKEVRYVYRICMLVVSFDALGEHKEGGEIEMSSIFDLLRAIREFFSKNSDEELFEEMGIVTPRKARDPITQSRLKAMVPTNEDLARRQAEINLEIASADEAGVARK